MSLAGKKIMFAWELGEGLGHLPVLKGIAGALRSEGVQPVFVLRETQNAIRALKDVGGELRTAPHWAKPALPVQRSGSLADILASNGYSQGDHAAEMIQSWDKIIDEVRPDLIIADHAPSALLSAHGRIPVALVGNGFAVPPADDDWFPPFNAGVGTIDAQRSVFDAISQGFERLGRPAPTSITAPFRGAFRGIYTFPVLDTYRAIRQEGLLGPIEPMPSLAPLPERRRIFIDSAAEIAKIDMLMQCIMAIGPEASVYLRGSPGPRAAILRSRGIEVFDTPPPLAQVLPRASVVFSHVGPGFTNAALACGRPHLMFPRHFEAHSAAMGLVEAGIGIRLDDFEPASFVAAYERACSDDIMRDAAQKAGAAAQEFMARARALEVSVAAVKRLLS